jgi:uridine kinase
MKIIGISGPSGSGKTTLAERMSKTFPNCKVIYGDSVFEVMHKNQKLVRIDNVSSEEISKNLPNNITNEKKLQQVELPQDKNEIRDFLNNIIIFGEDELKKQLLNAKKEERKFIIVEWIFLPALKIYDLCDYKIELSVNEDVCIARQKKRESDGGRKFVKGFADNAEFIRKKMTKGIASDYTLFLSENFDNEVDELCEKILNGENIRRANTYASSGITIKYIK